MYIPYAPERCKRNRPLACTACHPTAQRSTRRHPVGTADPSTRAAVLGRTTAPHTVPKPCIRSSPSLLHPQADLIIRDGTRLSDFDVRFRLRGVYVPAAGLVRGVLEPLTPVELPLDAGERAAAAAAAAAGRGVSSNSTDGHPQPLTSGKAGEVAAGASTRAAAEGARGRNGAEEEGGDERRDAAVYRWVSGGAFRKIYRCMFVLAGMPVRTHLAAVHTHVLPVRYLQAIPAHGSPERCHGAMVRRLCAVTASQPATSAAGASRVPAAPGGAATTTTAAAAAAARACGHWSRHVAGPIPRAQLAEGVRVPGAVQCVL